MLANGQEAGQASTEVGDGTHRIRLTWDAGGKRALFEVSKHWDGKHFHADSVVTVDTASLEFGGETRLFVGGANGDKFADLSLKSLTAEETDKAGFGDTFSRTLQPTVGCRRRLRPRPSLAQRSRSF